MWRRKCFTVLIVFIVLVFMVSPVLAQEPAPPIMSGESVDAFESDNTAETATSVSQASFEQIHNFGVSGDEDWIRFEAVPDARYVFKARPCLWGMDMTIRMELFRQSIDGLEIVAVGDMVGDESILTFVTSRGGTYFLRLTEAEGRGGADYAYVVSGNQANFGKFQRMIPRPTL